MDRSVSLRGAVAGFIVVALIGALLGVGVVKLIAYGVTVAAIVWLALSAYAIWQRRVAALRLTREALRSGGFAFLRSEVPLRPERSRKAAVLNSGGFSLLREGAASSEVDHG